MKISKQKENELYEMLYNKLMDARVNISMKLKGSVEHTLWNDIDDVMADLALEVPLKAIKLFNSNAL